MKETPTHQKKVKETLEGGEEEKKTHLCLMGGKALRWRQLAGGRDPAVVTACGRRMPGGGCGGGGGSWEGKPRQSHKEASGVREQRE